jgi:hypothetical protein
MKIASISFAISILLLSTSCQAPRQIYYWGNYESVLYATYDKPGKQSPQEQAQKLEEDLTKAAAKNLQPNPGLHAQLGYLYFQLGKFDAAEKEFIAEKTQFPESAALMDRLIAKLKGDTSS